MIIDGRAMAQDILANVRKRMDASGASLLMRAITVSPTPATQSYLKAKARAAETAGIGFEVVELPADSSTEQVTEAVKAPGADAIIVQLPLPEGINTEAVLASISLSADADALTSASRESGMPIAPVAAAVEEILIRTGIDVAAKRVVVIGTGRLVGEPVARRLASLGASVESYDLHTFSPDFLQDADIIVSGAGSAHLVKPEMVKEGVVLIDAGTSEANGALRGDIDPACALKAAVYTPVPGGVGPLTVACLMRNASQMAGQLHDPDIEVL